MVKYTYLVPTSELNSSFFTQMQKMKAQDVPKATDISVQLEMKITISDHASE